MALVVEPVLTKPSSSVMAPDWARSFEMSSPRSPSDPTTIGRSMVLPPISSFATPSARVPGQGVAAGLEAGFGVVMLMAATLRGGVPRRPRSNGKRTYPPACGV